MAQTKKKSIFFVVALVVLAALIVILAATLSACSGDEDEKTEPTPTETVQPEATTEPDSANLPTGAAAGSTCSTAVSGSNSTAAKQPSSDATEPTTEPTSEEPTEQPAVERGPLSDYEYGTDYISLYEAIGDQVTVDMVEEYDGLAYVTVDGVEYELGEDFLSMAMVYKTEPIEGNEAFDTADEIYNYWWKPLYHR